MKQIQEALKERFSEVHPLMFLRSVEKAKTDGELFDILDAIPTEFPIVWSEEKRIWEHTDNLLQGIPEKEES